MSAVVLYLNFATIFAHAYGLIWQSSPGRFCNLRAPMGETEEIGTMPCFSLKALATTGRDAITPADPFADRRR
jgi:hypothetical protein